MKKITSYIHNILFYKEIFKFLFFKHLSIKEITYFIYLLRSKHKIKNFYKIIKSPITLDLSRDNIYSQIPGFSPDELEHLFINMSSSSRGNVSLGPGEIFLTMFFNNVSKNINKGDITIEGIGEIELKSRTGEHGSIVAPKYYSRGSFTTTIKPHISCLIDNLLLNDEDKKILEKINSPKNGTWPIKINNIYQQYINCGGYKELFIDELNNMLSNMYPTLSISADQFIIDDVFDIESFVLYLSKSLTTDYMCSSTFKYIMFMNYKGEYKLYDEHTIIPAIDNKDIKISSPSDLLPRLKI